MRHAVRGCNLCLNIIVIQVLLLFSDVYVCASRELSLDIMKSYIYIYIIYIYKFKKVT